MELVLTEPAVPRGPSTESSRRTRGREAAPCQPVRAKPQETICREQPMSDLLPHHLQSGPPCQGSTTKQSPTKPRCFLEGTFPAGQVAILTPGLATANKNAGNQDSCDSLSCVQRTGKEGKAEVGRESRAGIKRVISLLEAEVAS